MMHMAAHKQAKDKALEKLISMLFSMEAKEHDPLSEHQNQKDKVLDEMDDVIEPDYDSAATPHVEEPDPEAEDEGGSFAKEREAFMKRGSRNPIVAGKTRMLMMAADSKPRGSGLKKKGY